MKVSRHLRASLEEAGLVMHQAPDVEVEIFVGEEPTVQDAEIELKEAAEEVEESNEAVEVLENAAATMESIAIAIEEIVEAGGELEPQAVDQIEERVEEVLEDVGLGEADLVTGEVVEGEGEGEAEEQPVKVEVIASTESFSADRRTASLESLDKVKDFLHKLWMGIRAAVIRAYEAVANFFASLWDATGRISKRVAELKKAAGEIGAKKAKEAIAFRSAPRLAYKGKFDGASVVAGLNATAEVGNKVFGDYAAGVIATYKALAGDMSEADKTGKAVDGLEGVEISGDYKFEVTAGKSSVVPTLMAPEKRMAQEAAIKPLSVDQITAALNAVEKLNKQIEGKKAVVKSMSEAAAKVRANIDEELAKADRNAAMKAVDRLKFQAKVRLAGKPWSRPVTQFSASAFGAMRAALVLAERSIAAYKEEAKKD